jgi:hypothetical protein
MCAEHGSVELRERPPVTVANGSPAAPAAGGPAAAGDPDVAKPTSREFAGLKLLPAQTVVHHCADHHHVVRLWNRMGPVASGVLGRQQPTADDLPPLPVFPDVNTVTVVERLTGQVQLADTGYHSTQQPVEGSIVIGMTHPQPRWQETLARYRKRHQLQGDDPVTFSAGFALLRGKAGLAFDPGQAAVSPGDLSLTFSGDVGRHDLFHSKPSRPPGEWELNAGYRLQPARTLPDIPLWIVPSLGATSGKRVLMIDLHWNMPEVDGTRPELKQFELIEFQVPHQWGTLKRFSPAGASSPAPAPGQPRVIRWRQHRPANAARSSQSKSASRSMTLEMEFEKPILDQPRLSGLLRATFDRTLSGVTGVGFYYAGGGPGRDSDVQPCTEISVQFDVSLGGLRYQERRAVPDDGEVAGEDLHRPKSDEFFGVIPDHNTVIELTNAISADGYYVKTVVEDHPNRDSSDKTWKRGWDITGRWYEGVFPINFFISLHGTEPADPVANPGLARTEARLTVDGTFPNAEMKRKIEDKWDGLHQRVTELLAARAVQLGDAGPVVTHGLPYSPPPAMLAAALPPLSFPDLAELDPPAGREDEYSDDVVVPAVVISWPDGLPPGSPDESAGLSAELQRQRKDLRLMLTESGQLSEQTCRAAIDDVKAELSYLKEPGRETPAEIADLLRQRKGLRWKLIARQMSEDFYCEEMADISAELSDLGWVQ